MATGDFYNKSMNALEAASDFRKEAMPERVEIAITIWLVEAIVFGIFEIANQIYHLKNPE